MQQRREKSNDLLVVNEGNSFVPDVSGHLGRFSRITDLPSAGSAPSGHDTFHIVLFSKKPLHDVQFLAPPVPAGMLALVDTMFGEVAIVSTHLTPFSEDERLTEIDLVLKAVEKHPNTFVLGDLNTLSVNDGCSHLSYDEMNTVQREIFTTDTPLLFNSVCHIEKPGFIDTAVSRTAITNSPRQPQSPTRLHTPKCVWTTSLCQRHWLTE